MANTTLAKDGTQPVQKFMFSRSFADDLDMDPLDPKQAKKPTYTQEQLDEAKRQSFDEGKAAGQKAMMDDQQKYLNVLLSGLDKKLGHMSDTMTQFQQQLLTHAQGIALAIAKKILPAYTVRYGLDEIEAIVSQVLTDMAHEPRLVVRVGEAQFETVSGKMSALAEQKAYSGKVVVLCEESLGPTDCRIEWADGGIERDINTLWQCVDKLLAHTQTAPEQAPQGGDKGETA